MNVLSMGNVGIISTNREMSIVIGNHIYGPFPKEDEMCDLLIQLFDDPKNKITIDKINFKYKNYLLNRYEI